MMAVYRANPDASAGISIFCGAARCCIPGADEIAAQNQTEATNEVHRQMSEWRGTGGAPATVTCVSLPGLRQQRDPVAAIPRSQRGSAGAQDRVGFEGQLAESHRLIDIRNSELSALQRKLGVPPTGPTPAPPSSAPTEQHACAGHGAAAASLDPGSRAAAGENTHPGARARAASVQKKPVVAPVESGSWIDGCLTTGGCRPPSSSQ